MPDAAMSLNVPSDAASAQANGFTASEVFQSILRRGVPPRPAIALLPPDQVEQTTIQLVTLVQTLCSPESGWPADKPQTPETLLPYVSDEAEELSEALQQWQRESPPEASTPLKPNTELVAPVVELFADLATDLVWSIAASTPEAMLLLEGWPDGSEETSYQGIRLVPVLTVQWGTVQQAFDLVTQTEFGQDPTLPDDRMVRLCNGSAADVGIPLSHWRDWFWYRATAIAPELIQWQQGYPLQMLLPGHPWRSAEGTLSLQFVALEAEPPADLTAVAALPPPAMMTATREAAMPTSLVWTTPLSPRPTDLPATDQQRLPPAPTLPTLATQLTFKDERWLQWAIAAAISPDIRAQLNRSPQDLKFDPRSIVQTVFQVLTPTHPSEENWDALPHPLTLKALCTQVQWCWLRASRSLMPLMAGVPVYRLRSGKPWQTGTLVVNGQLMFRCNPHQWSLNISNGQWETEPPTLADTDILQLHALTSLERLLWSVSDLQTHLHHQLRARSPAIAHLMTPTPVSLTPTDQVPLPSLCQGVLSIQLNLTLGFYSLE